jgi:hypothetical protein
MRMDSSVKAIPILSLILTQKLTQTQNICSYQVIDNWMISFFHCLIMSCCVVLLSLSPSALSVFLKRCILEVYYFSFEDDHYNTLCSILSYHHSSLGCNWWYLDRSWSVDVVCEIRVKQVGCQ